MLAGESDELKSSRRFRVAFGLVLNLQHKGHSVVNLM